MGEAHAEGCRFVKDSAMVPVDAPYDIVVTTNSGYPLDLNLYQTVKGMSAAAQIVKTGGSIIVAAECWDGIPDHGLYGRLLAEAADPASLLESMRRADSLQQDTWQAQIHASICQKADVYLFTENLTDEQIERAMLRPCRDIPETIDHIRCSCGGEVSIGILPEGPLTIPYIRS
jgi:nickel-dependent lactate racemase